MQENNIQQSDLKELLVEERKKQLMIKKYLPCKSVDLFNFLQDCRHIALIDMREEELFEQGFVRDSYNLLTDKKNSWLGTVEMLKNRSKKATDDEIKFGSKPIRRIVIIPRSRSEAVYAESFNVALDICRHNDVQVDKVYILADSFEEFQAQFGYLCLSREILQAAKEAGDGRITNMAEVAPARKRTIYCYSRFPTILVETQLLLGTVFNLNSSVQLNDLVVKSLVRFEAMKVVKGEDNHEYTTWIVGARDDRPLLDIKLNVEKYIDFDGIFAAIDELPPPRLLCCSDYRVSAVFAVGYLMSKNKINFNKASLLVFSKIGTTDVDKTVYSQVMSYQPGNKFKVIA